MRRDNYTAKIYSTRVKLSIIIVAALLLLIEACGEDPSPVQPSDPSLENNYTGQTLLDSLWSIFDGRSRLRMHALMRSWHKKPDLSTGERGDLMRRDLYDIVVQEFTPDFPDTVRASDLADPFLLEHGKYIVCTDTMDYGVFERWEDWNLYIGREDIKPVWRTMFDFRPPVNTGSSMVLYFDTRHEDAFLAFLNGRRLIEEPQWPDNDDDSTDIRFSWVYSYFPIQRGHWGYYYHLETLPYVGSIVMSPENRQARVAISEYYSGAVYLFGRDDRKWHIMVLLYMWMT